MLPARLLLDVARALPSGPATLELRPSEGDVEIVSGSATFHIRTLRAEDFPPFPEPGGDQVVRVPTKAFVETAAKVARSASRDETRPILTGILVSAAGSDLRMVATDSYRLSVKETQLEAPLDGSFEANVPARALQELVRIAQAGGDGEVEIGVRANQVVFDLGRHRALVAAHRRSVPELPSAPARYARARAHAADARAHATWSAA